ncbi:MAG: hypothetical protein PWQ10_186 [Patescibacteria group bacterium]|nr:hypothetical protein [Patescibacteria group bacterium]
MFKFMTIKPSKKDSFISKHLFLLMIILAIIITSLFVVVSMLIYNSNGAAQVDLSRPGYVSVRAQSVTNSSNFKDYSASGEINQETIEEFQQLFADQLNKAKAIDAFGGDPLSPASLGISVSTEQP